MKKRMMVGISSELNDKLLEYCYAQSLKMNKRIVKERVVAQAVEYYLEMMNNLDPHKKKKDSTRLYTFWE